VPYLFGSTAPAIWAFNFYSGIAWGGFNISNFNYLLRTTEKEKSDHYIAFASAVTAISLFIFSLLGGFLSTRLPVLFEWQLQSLFAVSCACRLIVVLVLFRVFRQKEIRTQEGIMELVNEQPGYRIGMEVLRQVFRPIRGKFTN
jgi:MFS family permease